MNLYEILKKENIMKPLETHSLYMDCMLELMAEYKDIKSEISLNEVEELIIKKSKLIIEYYYTNFSPLAKFKKQIINRLKSVTEGRSLIVQKILINDIINEINEIKI